MSPRMLAPTLPFDPVAAEFPGFYDLELAAHCGTTRRNIQRWRRQGLTVRSADQLACRIGMHPLEVWGTAWIAAEDECDRLNAEAERHQAEMRVVRIRRGVERRRQQRQLARERAGWVFMDARWRQWAAQWDRNTLETAQRGTEAPMQAL